MRVDPHHFVEVAGLACGQAAAVARQLQQHVRLERKEGQDGPEAEALTAVDLAAQEVVLQLLHHHFPGVAVDAEEDTPTVARFPAAGPGRDLVVLDPVDGTLSYAWQSPDYAVMASLLRDGVTLAAVLVFPASGVRLDAVRRQGARRDGVPVRIDAAALPRQALLTPTTHRLLGERVASVGVAPVVTRCSAVDSTAPVLGRALAAVTRGVADRRRGIGFLVTTEAGGAVRVGGRRWDGVDPALLGDEAAPTVVAADEATADRLLEAIR